MRATPAAPATQPSPNSGSRFTSGRSPIRLARRASSDGTLSPVTVVEMMRSTSSGLQPRLLQRAGHRLLAQLERGRAIGVVGRGEPAQLFIFGDRDGQPSRLDPGRAGETLEDRPAEARQLRNYLVLTVHMRWQSHLDRGHCGRIRPALYHSYDISRAPCPAARAELLARPYRDLDRAALEPELLAELALDEPHVPGVERPGREQHEPRRARCPAWVANSTRGARPPRTGCGVACTSAVSHWLSCPVGDALLPAAPAPCAGPARACRRPGRSSRRC